jgi:hypothetical protein
VIVRAPAKAIAIAPPKVTALVADETAAVTARAMATV